MQSYTNEILNQKSTHRAQTSAKQLITPYSIYSWDSHFHIWPWTMATVPFDFKVQNLTKFGPCYTVPMSKIWWNLVLSCTVPTRNPYKSPVSNTLAFFVFSECIIALRLRVRMNPSFRMHYVHLSLVFTDICVCCQILTATDNFSVQVYVYE